MTDKLFKFQNIQLIPTNTRATRQNTVLPTEGTTEEQFAAIEASTRQQILNDIRQHQLPTAPEQSPDVSSSSLEDKGPPNDIETVITTSSSSFEIVHRGDNEQDVCTILSVPYKQLTAPLTAQDIQDIWSKSFSEDDEGDITAVDQGMSNLTVKADIHTSKSRNVKSTIEADNSEGDDDTDDEADEEDIQFLRQLKTRCESFEIQIVTNGFRSCLNKIHDLIPDLYANCFDLKGFPYLADYYKQAIGTLPMQDFLRNILDLVLTDYPHLQPIQEYLYSVIKCFLVGLKHHDWMQFHYVSDRVVDPMITEEHIHESR